MQICHDLEATQLPLRNTMEIWIVWTEKSN